MIKWPKLKNIDCDTDIVIMTLGGSSASSSTDKIYSLAKKFEYITEKKILGIPGYATFFTSSYFIRTKIKKIVTRIKDKSGKTPMLIIVGKSMGGAKTWMAAKKLNKKGIDINLFIGVDMSKNIADHQRVYKKSEGKRGALYFHSNVKDLINFYQNKNDETQTGHPAIYTNPPVSCSNSLYKMCLDYNINVNTENFNSTTWKRDTT